MKYLIICLLLLSSFNFASAQSNFNFNDNLRIDLNTDNLEPGTKVTASLNSYSLSETISSINWLLDGTTLTESKNLREIDLTLKDLGKDSIIDVYVETTIGKTYHIQKVITPVYLDIIIEPQTRTPAFYKGRALPSVESTINLTAVINGNITNAGNYIYNWSLNNARLNGGAIIGNYKASTEVPLSSFNVLSLSVTDKNNKVIAKKSINIPTIEPLLLFYTEDTLYGLNHTPLKTLIFNENNIKVKAEPYYLDLKTYNQPQVIEWKTSGVRIPSENSNPYEINLSKSEYEGSGKIINFRVRNNSKFLQGADASFKIN